MKAVKPLLLLFCFTFLSCQSIVGCLLKIEAKIVDRNLNNGIISQLYEDYVEVTIVNASDEYYYIKEFTIEGNLPPGITATPDGTKLYLDGRPTLAGTYDFNVTLILTDYNDENSSDRICGNTVSKSFQITIY